MEDAQHAVDTSDDIRSVVGEVVSRISRIKISEIEDDVLIREELGVDSLMAMEIVAKCEVRLGIELDEGALGSVETVGDFLSYVEAAYRSANAE